MLFHKDTFTAQVVLHVFKPFDDRVDPLFELGASEIVVDHLHLGFLTYRAAFGPCDFDQPLPQGRRKRDGIAGCGDPDAIHLPETVDPLWQSRRHQNRNLTTRCALIVAQFCKPPCCPILGTLAFPKDCPDWAGI